MPLWPSAAGSIAHTSIHFSAEELELSVDAGGSVALDTVEVALDVLCYAPRDASLAEVVAEYLRPALSTQLQVRAQNPKSLESTITEPEGPEF